MMSALEQLVSVRIEERSRLRSSTYRTPFGGLSGSIMIGKIYEDTNFL